jgi:steroid delta-isomerase-like uncharacterized protein
MTTGVSSVGAPPSDLRERALWIFGLLDRHDLSRAAEIWKPDAVDYFLAVGPYRGRDAIVGFFEEMFAAFPDFRIQVEDVVVDGRRVAVRWTAGGTFDGAPFLGVDATGNHVELRGIDFLVMAEDGLVVENTIYYDGAGFARQIGMLPAQGSTADRVMTVAFNALTRLRQLLGRRGR